MRATLLVGILLLLSPFTAWAASLTGQIVDADSGQSLPARLYVQSDTGEWFFAKSASPEGSAFEYRREYPGREGKPAATEMHTSLSAHPFVVDLPPGSYTFTVERGKEYLTTTLKVTVTDEPAEVTIKLKRWINMAERGWYSGDTHNHVPLAELPNRMLAEDLNVALPITYWVTDSTHNPKEHNKVAGTPPEPKLIEVAPGHVIWPVNTEYEIFSVGGKPHTLGAMILVNHREAFEATTPPVGPVADLAHRHGALIDIDKHNWPWSMMLIPAAKPDLFELTNNHLWRTNFHFGNWYPEYAADYMKLEKDSDGLTERGWLDFGLQNYYALLNCGYRLRPTAGTAAGVHPVPLGFGRVYVHLDGPFSYDKWIEGLNAGRSFVTTGPMIEVKFNGKFPGHMFTGNAPRSLHVKGEMHSAGFVERYEVIVNGEVQGTFYTPPQSRVEGAEFVQPVDTKVSITGSSWFAIRCFEKSPDGRVRFAHTAPVFVDVPGKPLRPRKVEVEYLIQRVQQEIDRNKGVLPAEAMAEYEKALRTYESLLQTARDE